MGGQRQRLKRPMFAVDPKVREAVLETERVGKPHEDAKHNYYDDGVPYSGGKA